MQGPFYRCLVEDSPWPTPMPWSRSFGVSWGQQVHACRAFDTELAEACHAYGIKLLSYGSLNGGFLSGKYLHGARPEGARHSKDPEFQHRYCSPRVEKALYEYKAIADANGLSLTQLVIAWCAKHPLWNIFYNRIVDFALLRGFCSVVPSAVEKDEKGTCMHMGRLWVFLGV